MFDYDILVIGHSNLVPICSLSNIGLQNASTVFSNNDSSRTTYKGSRFSSTIASVYNEDINMPMINSKNMDFNHMFLG